MDSRLDVKKVTTQFKALQRYMSSSALLNHKAFQASIGYDFSDHGSNYANKQVANTVADLKNTTVKPFTLFYFFKHHLGESAATIIKEKMISEFGDSKYGDIQKAIEDNSLTEQQLDDLKEEIEDQVLELLGPFRILLVEIPLISHIEDAIADVILGDHVEEIRDSIANMNIPGPFSDLLCEN